MHRFARAVAVRPSEGIAITLVTALFTTVEAGRGLGEVGADTLPLSRLGASALPALYVVLGVTTLVVALGFGAAIGRLRMGPFFVALLAAFAALLAGLGVIARVAGDPAFPLIGTVVYVVGLIEGTAVWALAGAVLDARQAKRLFPLCESAAILGGFVGTIAAGQLARLVGAELFVTLDGVLLALAALVVARATASFGGSLTARRRPTPLLAQVRSGYEYMRGSPLMRAVAAAYVIFSEERGSGRSCASVSRPRWRCWPRWPSGSAPAADRTTGNT